ncbi:conjugal transfer protein TraR [Sphingomonas sp. DT-207]|uniref:conjugal transfer protein TraR n=1 Tax=Sphingomonas sp. DT-207 TaxID=3396167 RepID=UPI003F194EF3
MADLIDGANKSAEEHLARSLRAARAAIPPGVPGECEECGEDMLRLVDGRCGFCGDERRRD